MEAAFAVMETINYRKHTWTDGRTDGRADKLEEILAIRRGHHKVEQKSTMGDVVRQFDADRYFSTLKDSANA